MGFFLANGRKIFEIVFSVLLEKAPVIIIIIIIIVIISFGKIVIINWLILILWSQFKNIRALQKNVNKWIKKNELNSLYNSELNLYRVDVIHWLPS